MSGPAIVLYASSCAATAKAQGDIRKLRLILDIKQVQYEEVDLAMHPERREAMLAGSDGVRTLPQLHVGGKYLGTADDVQEFEDWGELSALLRGEVPQLPAELADLAAHADAVASIETIPAVAAATATAPLVVPAVLHQRDVQEQDSSTSATADASHKAQGTPGVSTPAQQQPAAEQEPGEEQGGSAGSDADVAQLAATLSSAAFAAAVAAAEEQEVAQYEEEVAAASATLTSTAFAAALQAAALQHQQGDEDTEAVAAQLVAVALSNTLAATAAAELVTTAFANALAPTPAAQTAVQQPGQEEFSSAAQLPPAQEQQTAAENQGIKPEEQPAAAAASELAAGSAAAAAALEAVRQLAPQLIDRAAGARLAPFSFPTSEPSSAEPSPSKPQPGRVALP